MSANSAVHIGMAGEQDLFVVSDLATGFLGAYSVVPKSATCVVMALSTASLSELSLALVAGSVSASSVSEWAPLGKVHMLGRCCVVEDGCYGEAADDGSWELKSSGWAPDPGMSTSRHGGWFVAPGVFRRRHRCVVGPRHVLELPGGGPLPPGAALRLLAIRSTLSRGTGGNAV